MLGIVRYGSLVFFYKSSNLAHDFLSSLSPYTLCRHIQKRTMPDSNYISSQKEISWKMRGILVDWLIEVHNKFRLLPETLYLAVNLIDRFLSVRQVSLNKLQLVGCTGLFIACKFEEICCPSVASLVAMVDNGYTDEEMLKAERYVLQVLDWNVGLYPSPMNFLRRVSKADHYDIQTRTLAKYLMEHTLVDYRFLPYPPSHVAAASMLLSRIMLRRHEEWVRYSLILSTTPF